MTPATTWHVSENSDRVHRSSTYCGKADFAGTEADRNESGDRGHSDCSVSDGLKFLWFELGGSWTSRVQVAVKEVEEQGEETDEIARWS